MTITKPMIFKKYVTRNIALLLSLFVLAACGGGGSGGEIPNNNSNISLNLFQFADVVIGQTDFTGSSSNAGNMIGANTISSPYGNPAVDTDGTLYLPDYNNRLLGFNSLPIGNNTAANFVLGQVDFTTSNPLVTNQGFSGVQTVALSKNKMILTSYSNNRILIWNSIPKSGAVPADVVLGQPDFISNGSLY